MNGVIQQESRIFGSVMPKGTAVAGELRAGGVLGGISAGSAETGGTVQPKSAIEGTVATPRARMALSVRSNGILGGASVNGLAVRRPDYIFSEGDVNGAFAAMPVDTGITQHVPIHGLHDISFDGDVGHLTQSDTILVLNCGTSTEVI